MRLEIALMARDAAADSPYYVGREAELDSVRSLVHDAALGDGSALVWLGEPGIGKSRLLRECARNSRSVQLVSVRCGAPAQFGPDLASQLAVAFRVPREADGGRKRTAALLEALAKRARHRPVALLVDDVHLADASERATLNGLVALTGHHRLAVVGTAEEDGWRGRIAARRLSPLDEAATEVLVRSLAGVRALSNDDVHEIVRTAQGNPRFAIELVRNALQPRRDAPLVPESARAAAAQIRADLSRAEFEILSACSIIGDTFRGEWLPEIVDRPRIEVADALQRASDLGVLFEQDAASGWFAFRREALRKALCSGVVSIKREILHQRVVQRLGGEREADTRTVSLLAHHAEIVEDHECAAASFMRAADQFGDSADFAAAAEFYVRAAAHAERGGARWVACMKQTMRCYINTSDFRRMSSVARSVVETLDASQEAETVSNALDYLFLAQLIEGDLGNIEETIARFGELGLPNSENRKWVAMLTLAYWLSYTGRLSDATRLFTKVPFDRLENDEARLRYFIAKAEIEALVTPLRRTLAVIDQAVEAANRMPALRAAVSAYGSGVEIACRFGDLRLAREYAERADAVAAKREGTVNDLRHRALKERMRIALLAGDVADAKRLFHEHAAWRASGRHSEAFDASAAVTIGMRSGDLALVDAFFDSQLLHDAIRANDAESCGMLLAGFGEVMQVRGMSKDLRGVLERCVSEEFIDPYTAIQLWAARVAAIGCAARAVEQTERYFTAALAPSAQAHVAFCKATLLSRQGRHAAAAELASKAAARFGEIGWRLYQAGALELAGNPRAAARVYAQCGATADVARLAAGETYKAKYAPFGARLSPRQREVARLVAAKRSNREIATVFEVSVRTIEHHVEAAFSKLGIRARWELTPEMLDPPAT